MIFGTPPIVTNGLVLHLDAANRISYPGSGTTWTDLSGNGYTGTLTNGPTFSSTNQGIISFDGTNDGVDCGNNFNLQYFTAITWARFVSSANANFLFSNGSFNTPTIEGWGLTVDSSTTIRFDHTAVASVITHTSSNLYDGKWRQLGIFRNNSNIAGLIIDGMVVAQTTYSTSFTNSNLWLGLRTGGTQFNPFFKGDMAQMMVYNRGLNQQEILQNYNALKSRFGLT